MHIEELDDNHTLFAGVYRAIPLESEWATPTGSVRLVIGYSVLWGKDEAEGDAGGPLQLLVCHVRDLDTGCPVVAEPIEQFLATYERIRSGGDVH